MMLDPAFAALIIAAFTLLFASAAIHKLRDLRRFDSAFSAYDLLPSIPSRRLSWLIPLLETGVACALLWSAARAYAVGIGMGLLLGYAAAMAFNLRRGRRDIACGCGGPDDRRPIAAWMAWRNLSLAALLGTALLPWSPRPLGLTDAVTIGFGSAAAVVFYRCLDQLGLLARRSKSLQGQR
jgi:Methylamine utilisation protein MauE